MRAGQAPPPKPEERRLALLAGRIDAARIRQASNAAVSREDVEEIEGVWLPGKEPVIPPGTAADYWRGDKSWRSLPEAVQDIVGAFLGAGAGIVVAYNDGADSFTIGLDAGVDDISGLSAALAAKIAASEKGAASGVASLDAAGRVPSAQLPAIAFTDVHVVASQAAQLALTAEEGDVAVRSDQNKSYVHNGGAAGSMADWTELLTPTDAVLSVNGMTGAVTITDLSGNAGTASALQTTRSIAMTGDVSWSVDFDGSGNVSAAGTIGANKVTDAMLRQSAGLSLVGRSASSSGNVADLAAGSDHEVMRRSGTSIGFGAVNLAQAAAVTGILAAANGGTGNAFFQVSGPASSVKTLTFPNASDTVACLGQAQTFAANQRVNAKIGIGKAASLPFDLTDGGGGWELGGLEGTGTSQGAMWQYKNSSGHIWTAGANGLDNSFRIRNSAGTSIATVDGSGVGVTGALAASTTLKSGSYTVATLPAAATAGAGARAYVTDCNTTTFNATAAGGGASKVKVTSDGNNWKVG